MARVKIPFIDEFKGAMLSGGKIATLRSKRYGKPGDTFKAFGATFRIHSVVKVPVYVVWYWFWSIEGFRSSQEFYECWSRLHPRVGWDKSREYFFHLFFKLKTDN